MERRLAAILAADLVGYTRLMGADEVGTLSRFSNLRHDVIEPIIAKHHGRVFKLVGDGLLVEFASVVDAVMCADEWQNAVTTQEAAADEEKQLKFRIGINVGDVIVEGDDIYGDGVNIAARIEAMAEPGGICLSVDAYRHSRGKLHLAFEDLGSRDLKNVAEPVRVYRVLADQTASTTIPRPTSPLEMPDKPSIAVMPFENLSGDADQEYFADGMAEDITTELSKFHALFVISRNSTFAFKGKSVRPDQVARDLGVRYVLQGSVRRSGNRIRTTATLADTERGHQIWADRFDRHLDDLFEVQDEITRKVVAIVGYQLEQAEITRVVRKRTDDITAWGLVVQGLPHFYEHTCEGNDRAKEFFQKAIERDSHYSEAWAYLAWTYGHDNMVGCSDDKKSTTKLGLEAGQRAIELDADSYLAHLALSSVYIWSDDVRTGLAVAQRALELNPNDVRVGLAVGNRLTLMGRFEEGIEMIKSTLSLNPLDPFCWHYFGYLARSYLSLGDTENALDWARRAVQLRPDQADAHFRLALCHAHRDDREGAKKELDECDALQPGFVSRRKSWNPYPDSNLNDHLLAPLRANGLL